MLIGDSMDIVSMPKVPGYRTTVTKIPNIQAVDTISVRHNVFRFELNGGKYAAEVQRELMHIHCFN
jgi:tRNA(Glu) U13 pseudouridine synthase TruD